MNWWSKHHGRVNKKKRAKKLSPFDKVISKKLNFSVFWRHESCVLLSILPLPPRPLPTLSWKWRILGKKGMVLDTFWGFQAHLGAIWHLPRAFLGHFSGKFWGYFLPFFAIEMVWLTGALRRLQRCHKALTVGMDDHRMDGLIWRWGQSSVVVTVIEKMALYGPSHKGMDPYEESSWKKNLPKSIFQPFGNFLVGKTISDCSQTEGI